MIHVAVPVAGVLTVLSSAFLLWLHFGPEFLQDALTAPPKVHLTALLTALFMVVALQLAVMGMLLYMFYLSRQWSGPRHDAKLGVLETRQERLEGNLRALQLRHEAWSADHERDEHEWRKEIRALTEVVRASTLNEERLRTSETRLDEHERLLRTLRPWEQLRSTPGTRD